jgi:hypothetical protein
MPLAMNRIFCWYSSLHLDHGTLTARLVYRFKDGSIDHEAAVFTQEGRFRLVNDYKVPRGANVPTLVT